MEKMLIEEVYTLVKACEFLDIKERSLGDLLRAGKIKGYKKLNKWYILKSDLLAYITTNEKSSNK